MNSYNSLSDDFSITMFLASKIEMPNNRETVLHFFEVIQKQSPELTDFEKRDGNEYVLEEDRESGSYRWVGLDHRRLSSGWVNPVEIEEVDKHNERLLEMAPYHLGMTTLDADMLDLTYSFDLLYGGNHDEITAEVLAGGAFESLSKIQSARVLNYQPAVMMVLDESCQLQCRLSIETRTTLYQLRTRNFPESPISIYFTVRQLLGKQPGKSLIDFYRNQRRVMEELIAEHVIPNVIQPLVRAISAKQ